MMSGKEGFTESAEFEGDGQPTTNYWVEGHLNDSTEIPFDELPAEERGYIVVRTTSEEILGRTTLAGNES